MIRAGLVAGTLAALAAGCNSDQFVVVTVAARPAVTNVAELDVTIAASSATLTRTLAVDGHDFPATFSLEEQSTDAPLTIAIAALDGSGNAVGSGSATTAAGATAATVTLDPVDFVVNTDYPMDQTLNGNFEAVGVQLAATSDDLWTVGFRDNCAAPCNVFGRRFDAAAQPVATILGAGSNQFPLSTTQAVASSEITPALAVASDVTLAIWDSHVDNGSGGTTDGISCRVLDRNGSAGDAETSILTADDTESVSAVGLANGDFALAWQEANPSTEDFEIRGAIIHPDCSIATPPISISTSDEVTPHGPHVALNSGSLIYAWIDSGDVHLTIADSSLDLTTANITLVQATATENADYVRVAPLGSAFAVAIRWAADDGTSPGRIEVWPVDFTGTAISGPILITAQAASDFESIDSFTLAPRGDGALLVSWSACLASGDGQGCGVFGRVIRPSGTPVGDTFTIPTTLVGDQLDPSAVALTDAFAVAWDDESEQAPDVSGFAVRARIIYPPYDDAVSVEGAACGSALPACNSGLTCAAGTDGSRCFLPCDSSQNCPSGGTCTSGTCVF